MAISRKSLIRHAKWSLLSALVGVLAGLAATLFLGSLEWVTAVRERHPELIWFLPLGGLAIGLLYHHFGKDVAGGNALILDEIHDPKKQIPLRMTPLILLSTIVTHLFGGSAGREGTAVQMGASLADQLATFFRVAPEERKILLVAGLGAGFGAAIGAPWAGAVFGMEVIHIGKLRLFAWFECVVASFVGYFIATFLHAPHSVFPKVTHVVYDVRTFFFVALFGCVCGALAFAFANATRFLEKLFHKIAYAPLKPFLAGILLVALYRLEGSYQYVGLGISEIQESFSRPVEIHAPILKGAFTALTVASGFKGGEFVPLVFMGATLGSALSVLLKISTPLLAALGFAAVFAGAANTPLACALMSVELFGPEIGVYALIACYLSYYCSGYTGIYRPQKVLRRKHHFVI